MTALPISPASQSALALASARPSGNIANNVTGPLASPVAGRTDHLPVSAPNGSYVIPADVVSALGEGNTNAGFKILSSMFQSATPPGSAPAPPVNIMAAGGEFVVPPDVVLRIGQGNMAQGHAALDSFVKRVRAENVKKLKTIPGPAEGGR